MFHPPCEGYRAEYNQPILIARNHDSRTCAFAFGELASGSHADFQLLGFSADNWAIEVRLIQSILDACRSCVCLESCYGGCAGRHASGVVRASTKGAVSTTPERSDNRIARGSPAPFVEAR